MNPAASSHLLKSPRRSAPPGWRGGLALALLVGVVSPLPAAAGVRADAVVAQDGSGQFTSVQDAISAAPLRPGKEDPRWVIRVKPGTYRERVYVQRERGRILLVGDDAARTIITFNLHADLPGPDGKPIGTFRTPTLQVDADNFDVENLTLANSSGPVGQALALRVDGDRVTFRHCRFLGWQDTILVNRGRHLFTDCYIEGHVDFIFGAATAWFARCEIHCLRDGYITAASTPPGTAPGLVFADCRITAEPGVHTYLGRPWRNFAQVAFLRTTMASAVRPEGWHDWNKPEARRTVVFAEYGSTGPGAETKARVPWARQLTAAEAGALTIDRVLGGNDGWHPEAAPAAQVGFLSIRLLDGRVSPTPGGAIALQ
ncbi:MAG: pectinesterase family protein [Opitutales bacterium]